MNPDDRRRKNIRKFALVSLIFQLCMVGLLMLVVVYMVMKL